MSNRVSRRRLIGGTMGGFFSLAMRHRAGRLLAAGSTPTGRAKRVVVLWMNGGPSQFETFDPKPGQSTGGQAQVIATGVAGLQISSFLPEIASRVGLLNVVRNLTSSEGEHQRAQYFMHTGYPFVEAFPRPSLGSIASHEMPASDIPNYVSLGSPGFGPAYLGPDHAPFSVEEPADALELLTMLRRRSSRLDFLRELTADFDRNHQYELLARRRNMLQRVTRLVGTPFPDALDVRRERESQRERYGRDRFGRLCLVARRLLESGVRFIEIRHDGWDTHSNNHAGVRRLCGEIDRPWAVLMDDLQSSGMLDETIVLWMGEFGRTPRINGQAGRDHFPTVTPLVIGGGGLTSGVIAGETNRNGTAIDGDSVRVADVFATILTQLGVNPSKEYQTSFESPAPATDTGTPLSELI